MQYSSLTADELVEVCATSGDPEAWQEFVSRFHKLIASAIIQVAYSWGERSHAVVEELVQDTYVKVCTDNRRMLRQFKPRHPNSFYQMMKVTAGNVARDYFRKEDSIKRGPEMGLVDMDSVESFVPDKQSAGAAQIEREVLIQQVDRELLKKCSARDRRIFWLHYRQGLTAEEIAAVFSYEPGTKGVEAALHRLRLLLCGALGTLPAGSEGISDQSSFIKGEGHR